MTKLDLLAREKELLEQYHSLLHEARMQYVELNKQFNVGDYIKSMAVNKIIKIDTIKYSNSMKLIEILYCGKPYSEFRGDLVEIEDAPIMCFSHNLEKIKI
jgi:hypothetical protein